MPSVLAKIVAVLRRGKIIIYPTETAYALVCDATNAAAVRKIFQIKGREKRKPLPLIVASRKMAEKYAHFGLIEKKLAKKYWPGPLTIVAGYREQGIGYSERMQKTLNHKPSTLAPRVIASDGTVAVRVSSNPLARGLSRALGRPIVATSANKSGDPAAYTVKDALRSLGPRAKLVDAVIDGGRLRKRKASTIVRVTEKGIQIVRKGAIKIPSPPGGEG